MDDKSAQPLDARMAYLEGAFVQVDKRLDSIDRRFDSIDRRREPHFAEVDPWLKRFNTRSNWLIGTIVASWVTTIGTYIGTTLVIIQHR